MGRVRRDKVYLTEEQKENLVSISRNGLAPAKKILHARILLMCDEGKMTPRKWTDDQIAEASLSTSKYSQQNSSKIPGKRVKTSTESSTQKDSCHEAKIRWSDRSLNYRPVLFSSTRSQKSVEYQTFNKRTKKTTNYTEISDSTVWRTLKKTFFLRPCQIQRFCIPERDLARFVAQMEVVIDLYSNEHSDDEPLITLL